MARRGKGSQTKHDVEVTRIANRLKNQGYTVKADVPGFPQPETMQGVRPDVDARRGRQREIVEVETPESLDGSRAQKQRQAFQQVAKRSKNTKFTRKVTGG